MCPVCHEPIAAAESGLTCSRHGRVGERDADGILRFDASSTYWGEVDRETMQRINRVAREAGWREALASELAPRHADLLRYVQDVTRADWLVLLPLDRERTVCVDVGAGWGAVSFGLAPHVRRHYAVEKIGERIEFLALRARQDAVPNLVPVRADLHALPFAPGSSDVIAVNGVLEWAGLVDPEAEARRGPRRPDRLQQDFMRRMLDLLRPGGWIYVGIENRYGRMFWRGQPDHQGLRFTSLMPRALARAYTRLRAVRSPRTEERVRDYRAWTYSLRGYRRLFRDCGFADVQAYAVSPGYNFPSRIVPLDASGPLRYLARQQRSPRRWALRQLLHRAAAATGIEPHVASCYAFVARRPERP